MKCPLCSHENYELIYTDDRIPFFGNKTYINESDAKNASVGVMNLHICKICRFAWNSAFDSKNMLYDETYQNEQGISKAFSGHLAEVVNIVSNHLDPNCRIVEIGCGKGTFLQMLINTGYKNITGYDPIYEGEDSRIIKSQFHAGDAKEVDFFILRHVLEHISNPYEFVKNIVASNTKKCLFYIEVPDFQWIIDNNAFWDITYEHCNYFSLESLSSMFHVLESGRLFGEQYIYIIGAPREEILLKNDSCREYELKFDKMKHSSLLSPETVLWGAATKGVNFARLMDPNKKIIKSLVDINPKKQNMYIGGSGHLIIPPSELDTINIKNIIIINPNYTDEIKNMVSDKNIKFCVL